MKIKNPTPKTSKISLKNPNIYSGSKSHDALQKPGHHQLQLVVHHENTQNLEVSLENARISQPLRCHLFARLHRLARLSARPRRLLPNDLFRRDVFAAETDEGFAEDWREIRWVQLSADLDRAPGPYRRQQHVFEKMRPDRFRDF